MRKKKVLFQTDSSLAKTGFGRSAKEILLYLHRTGKYDIVEYACGRAWSRDAEHNRKPWKSYGALPDSEQELKLIAPTPESQQHAAYGPHNLDKVIYLEKPDVYFAIQDIWGIEFAANHSWFDKITCVFWTTLDSLPIIKSALDIAPKVKNFWVWSKFAETAMKKVGHNHVRTVHGAIDASRFFKLPLNQRIMLRRNNKIPDDAFVTGFVFRNQPRKSVPNLLEGYSLFRKQNAHIKNLRLLLHTYWAEGWRIHELADEHKIPHEEIITTHVCGQCRMYRVQPYVRERTQCPFCGNKESLVSTNPVIGVSEEQLNEVYNLMDVYCHPFTSGGQEIPIQEAKFAELITLVTNYSCGEEMCEPAAGSFALDWHEYRETTGSQFIKASTSPFSIAKQLTKVLKMSPQEREKIGQQARKWALDNFSAEAIGKIIEKFIDESPLTTYDFKEEVEVPNAWAEIDQNLPDDKWLLQLYERVLGRKVDAFNTEIRMWIHQLKLGAPRQNIEKHVRENATQKTIANKKKEQMNQIKADEVKKILYVMPSSERDMFLSTALFKSLKEQYPEYKLYVATGQQFRGTLDGNPYVDEIVYYFPEMDNLIMLEGAGPEAGYFDIAFLPHLHTQRSLSYIHNGKSRIAYGKCISY